MSELSQLIALEIRQLSDAVVVSLVSCADADVSRMAAKEAVRRMLAEQPGGRGAAWA